MMARSVATVSTENTLRKTGAHLRWLMERAGVNPEAAMVIVGVKDEVERSLMLSAFLRDFDPASMRRMDAMPHVVEVHGVTIGVAVRKPEKET